MHRSSFVNSKHFARGAVAAAFSLLVFLSIASPAAAQSECAAVVLPRLLDTSDNCVTEPFRDLAKDVQTFTWKGHEYAMLNRGNELAIYDIDNPTNPDHVDTSNFNFGTVGDSDHDLLRFDISDESRFVVFSHKVKRTVVVDLGTASVPSFGSNEAYSVSDLYLGGTVFNKGGSNYLFAAGIEGGCETGSSLYLINDDDLQLIEVEPGSACFELGGSPVRVGALKAYDAPAGYFLYIGAGGTNQIYRLEGSGAGLVLAENWLAPSALASFSFFSIDEKNARAASSDYSAGVIGIWDLSNPASPSLMYEIPAAVRDVSLRAPSEGASSTLAAILTGVALSTRTWEVGPASAHEFAATFWSDPALPHNDIASCVKPLGISLSQDGSTLYMARNATHDIFDFTECLEPTPAVANLSITPSSVFPGQSIEIRDTSSGRIDEWALWLTREPDGTVVAGNDPPLNNSNPRTINYTIPQDLPASQSYVAHIQVDSSELTPADPYDERTVSVDRTPEASFTIEPSAVVVGETVTLTATAEGIVGSGGYQWQITDPSGSPASKTGRVVTHTLDESGDWDFVLTVGYDHEEQVPPYSPYTATYSLLDYSVTSVAADFFWTPSSPLHTQQITLDASTSKPSAGLSYQWQVVEKYGGPGGYDLCPAAIQCVIPAETFEPATFYSVTLTASNGPDTSVRTRDLFVGDGNIQPTISWSPTSPEIGETVVFSIEGVPLDIDSASWDMGGGGCDGADSTPDCIPTLWNNYDCHDQAYSYSSSGTKTVDVTFDVGENTFTAPPVQVTVQSSGGCDGGGPGVCEYSFSRTSFDIGANDTGSKTLTVSTTSSCSWTANAVEPWITVLSPAGEIFGSGTVRFEVAVNDGPARSGRIYIGGSYVIINQKAPDIPVNFTMSDTRPDIGEEVTFFVDPILEVASWNFGEPDCRGSHPVIDCSYLPPGSCNYMEWTFTSSGEKTVVMVLEDERSKTKNPIVTKKGQCCLKDGRPTADFEMSADEIYAGETVFFNDTSSKSLRGKALSFTWTPANPEIGENVLFNLGGVVGDVSRATWNFGEVGCDGASTAVCEPSLWDNCEAMTFKFASGGPKSVSVDVEIDGAGPETVGPAIVNVASAGSCDGGGGGCSYSLSPKSASFPPEGGVGSFTVSTTAECEWTATPSLSFIAVTSGEGPGPGRVDYAVSANEGTGERTGLIRVEGQSFRVSQSANLGDTDPTEWWWAITRIEDGEGQPVDEDVYSSTDPTIDFTFVEPGRYRVRLTATNCSGSDYEIEYIDVLVAPVRNFVVASAISSGGANGTQWESDFRFFNPCDESLDVSLVYQPDNVDNSAKQLSSYPFVLGPNETTVFPSAREVVEGYEGEAINGSLLIDSVSDSGCKVLSVSRTFNDTPDGTLGLFVPAMPVTSVGVETLNLTGLIRNDDYRSNLRLVNHGDTEAWVRITVFNKSGEALTAGKSVLVQSHSTKQINDVAGWAGVSGSLAQFTVLAEVRTKGAIIDGFATVVDNISGDSVISSSSNLDEPIVWLPGVVYAPGKNDTLWQTDVWFHNPDPANDWLASEATYLHGKDVGINFVFEYPEDWPAVEAMGMRRRLGIAESILDDLGLESTSGYMIFEGLDGDMAPQIAARTYTESENGGTYGLHLPVFGPGDLLQVGEVGYIVGVSNSADEVTGFRTNLGLLATGGTAEVEITFFYPDGSQAPEPWTTTIWAGQLKQINNVFSKFGLGNQTVTGTFKIEVLSGGDLVVYGTEVDNQIGDSIFIPAQQKYIGLAP